MCSERRSFCTDRMSEDMPEDMPEHMPEDMPGRMPEDMPDRMLDRMPENMSDRTPEDLPVTKCKNVMVGITRSKVILVHPSINSTICKFNFADRLSFCISGAVGVSLRFQWGALVIF